VCGEHFRAFRHIFIISEIFEKSTVIFPHFPSCDSQIIRKRKRTLNMNIFSFCLFLEDYGDIITVLPTLRHEGGVKRVNILLSVLTSVMADVLVHVVCKWLDRGKK
jgi:hypothetical protein